MPVAKKNLRQQKGVGKRGSSPSQAELLQQQPVRSEVFQTSVGPTKEPDQNVHQNIDVRTLVQWLGTTGAKAGLMKSVVCSTEILVMLAKSLGVPSETLTRKQLVDEIVKVANKRIDKPLKELYQMSKEELLTYFHRIEPTAEELVDLLRSLDLRPKREGIKGLIDLAAREISETGRFLRISSSTGRP